MCTPTRDEIQCTFNGVLHMYTIDKFSSPLNNTYIRHRQGRDWSTVIIAKFYNVCVYVVRAR